MHTARVPGAELIAQAERGHELRRALEQVAWIVWESESKSAAIMRSANWVSATGEPLGSDWTQAIHPDDHDAIVHSWQQTLQTQQTYRAEMRLKCEATGWRWTELHASPLMDDQQQVTGWLGFHIDISSRKIAEQQLVKNERHFNLALDLTRMSFWSLDPKLQHVRMDARMRSIWGEDGESEMIPIDRVMARIHPEDRPLVAESVSAALDPQGTGIYRPTDYRLVLDSGQIRWVAANGMSMFTGRGAERQAVELFGTVHDITERKRIEDSLRESEERLQQLNSQLEDRVSERTSELVDSEARLRVAVELAEQSSHQLRRLALELSRAEERERRRLAQVLHDHVQQLLIAGKMRIESLSIYKQCTETREQLVGVTTILDMALSATRSLSVELVPPVLHSQGLPTALQWLAVHIGDQHNLVIETEIDNSANPSSEEARDLLFQAARELLLNVIKHASVKHASLMLLQQSQQILLVVQDQGKGFCPDDTSGDEPTFGLFHLRERLAALGGRLDIASCPGEGSRVTVTLSKLPPHDAPLLPSSSHHNH